jgi:hypothetical protein
MSEMYRGVVFRSDEQAALKTFDAIVSDLRLRLVRLDRDVYGICLIFNRRDPYNQQSAESIAASVSNISGCAIALFYDNRVGTREGVLYRDGIRDREFGDKDAWWVPYGEDGDWVFDGPRFRESELMPDVEYYCIYSTIDAALESVAAGPLVNSSLVKQAFCYDETETLSEK